MKDNKFNDIYCSRNCQDFILLFDGIGNYYLYYQEQLLEQIAEPISPKELYKKEKTKLLVGTAKFENEKENLNKLIQKVYDYITAEFGNDAKTKSKVMRTLKDLFSSLSDAETDNIKNEEFFKNAPQCILDNAYNISADAGLDGNIFKEITTPKTIEEEIQQRRNPILTKEEKAKADAISREIDEKGLLPFLNEILDDIQIGEHKNIYRKTLSEFKIMRGELSIISETDGTAGIGKSYEDKIVFLTITPQRYIFEVNNMTYASFIRLASNNPEYFDRITLYFGDLGARKSFNAVEPIFNTVKPLITEKNYTDYKSKSDTDTEVITTPLRAESIGVAYQTTLNSFTKDDPQLISRTIYSTPPKVDSKEVALRTYYLKDKKSRQSKAQAKAEQKLKDFGLYLLQMVNVDIEIINPFFDVFWEYSSISENPNREFEQQLDLFDAYCKLTYAKCNREPKGTLFASAEQLKEFMDYVNLENALIPIENDFLQMIMAKDKSKELQILYDDADIDDAEKNGEDIDLEVIYQLSQCENDVLEQINEKEISKQQRFGDVDDDPIQSKGDLTPQQLKELPQKLLSTYGFRSNGAKARIFFRKNDIKHYYGKRPAYKNVDDVSQMLHTLYGKGYLGKYEYKHNRENLYYLTPKCNNLTKKFESKKSYNECVSEYFANAGYGNY